MKSFKSLFKSLSFLRGLNGVVRFVLLQRGFRFELRRQGEMQLGLWKKTLNKKRSDGAAPKRFVLVPGFGDSGISWLPVLSMLGTSLKDNFDEIILFDFPGYSGTLAAERPFHSIDFMMQATFDALDSLRPHTVLGHSLGAWLVAYYDALCGTSKRPAASHPSYHGPARIWVANPSGLYETAEIEKEWADFFKSLPKEGFAPLKKRLFVKEPLYFPIAYKELERFTRHEATAQFIMSVKRQHLLYDLLPSLQAEITLLWGEKDAIIAVTNSTTWQKGLKAVGKACPVVIFENVGHSIQLEAPKRVAVVLRRLLEGKIEEAKSVRGVRVIQSA